MAEDIVFEYFKRIKDKDVESLLNLFANDAVVYEPFSKSEGGLRGRSAIEPFLRVVLMANENLEHHIVIEKTQNKGNRKQVTALVRFDKGGEIAGRFTFEIDTDKSLGSKERKIKALHIEF